MNMNEKKSAFIAKIAEKGSAAQETEIAAMVNWGKTSSRQEALEMIKAHPGPILPELKKLRQQIFSAGWIISTPHGYWQTSVLNGLFKSFVRISSASIAPWQIFRGMRY